MIWNPCSRTPRQLLTATRASPIPVAVMVSYRPAMKTQLLTPAAGPVFTVSEIFCEQIEAAIDELGDPDSGAEQTNIHGARKQLKRARATLRLLRDALGDDVYRRENTSVRDAARPLSPIRDSEVLLDALDGVVKRFEGAAGNLPLDKLRSSLKHYRAELREASIGDSHLAQMREFLRGIERRARRWQIIEQGWPVIESGLKRTYREGRKAGAAAYVEPTADNLHEWRKQAKYLWHQLQLLERLPKLRIGELVDDTHALSDHLGDDHDLAVLRNETFQRVSGLDKSSASELKALIDRRRAELRARAFKLGERLYSDKPKPFARRFRPD